MRVAALGFGLALLGLGSSAQSAPAPEQAARTFAESYVRPTAIPHPKTNTHSPARVALGKSLFFDPRLSGSKIVSCATCHNPSFAWGDRLPKAVGFGMKVLGRRSPTVLNVAWGQSMFWDGRADSLEAQAIGPITSAGEMNLSLSDLEATVRGIAGYAPMFKAAYPGEGVNAKTIAKAIAQYERTVISGIAPFDRWVKGEKKALSASAKRGFVLFNGKARCSACHSGWRFTDDSFHDIGVPGDDLGRAKVIPLPPLEHAFKTPTLRNAVERAPYMHDGSEADLKAVIALYNMGGRVKRANLSSDIRPLGLSASESRDLLHFLQSLSSVDPQVTLPILPH